MLLWKYKFEEVLQSRPQASRHVTSTSTPKKNCFKPKFGRKKWWVWRIIVITSASQIWLLIREVLELFKLPYKASTEPSFTEVIFQNWIGAEKVEKDERQGNPRRKQEFELLQRFHSCLDEIFLSRNNCFSLKIESKLLGCCTAAVEWVRQEISRNNNSTSM